MASSRSSVRSVEAKPASRLGCERPRIWTPPLRRLTRRTSAGFECIEFAEAVLGIELYPWQKWLLVHALELLPDGTYRFRTVVLLVARQNGKSTLMQVLALWRMFVDGAPLVIGTAQNLDVAEEQWQGAVDIAESTPELAAEVAKVDKTNGKKALRLVSGERYKVAAASRRGGRGLSGDLILLDELREHQTWEAWGAVTKTTMARERAQVWAASNAGDQASIVLGFLRVMAHAAVGNPDDLPDVPAPDEIDEEPDGDSLGIFEWSATPGCDIWDRDGWAQANPSLGFGITERAIAAAARTDPEPVFRTEVLCQWVDKLAPWGMPPESWAATQDDRSDIDGQPKFALDVSPLRDAAAFAAGGRSTLGEYIHATVVDHRPGTGWVVDRAKELIGRWGGELMVSKGSPAAALVDDLEAAGVPVTLVSNEQHARFCGALYDAVVNGRFRHRDQAVLTAAVRGALKQTYGDAFLWSRRSSSVDITALVAVTLAFGAVLVPTAEADFFSI